MSKYMHGNLAVPLEQAKPRNKTQAGKQPRIVSIRHGLPVQEKMSYLFIVLVFILLSGILLSRYASIAELNYSADKTKKEIVLIEKENELLQLKVAELKSPDRIIQLAEEMGMSQKEGNVKILTIPAAKK